MSGVEDRLGNIEAAVATLIDKVAALDERVAYGFDYLSKQQTAPSPFKHVEPEAKTYPPSDETILDSLMGAGVDASMVEIDPMTGDISPVKFLGDQWMRYTEVFAKHGYGWVKAGKESRWSRKSAGVSAPTQAVSSSAPVSTGNAVEGTVKDVGPPREAKTARGPTKVQDFTLSTASGDVRVSIWEGVLPPTMLVGKRVRVVGVKPGQPYKGTMQYSGNSKTSYSIS